MKKPLLTIFYLALFCQYVVSQDVDKRYVMAYKEMTSMLEGKTDLSIKRAVFLSEWAIFQNQDAIQTENLILRLMGIPFINDGTSHGGFLINATSLPSFR